MYPKQHSSTSRICPPSKQQVCCCLLCHATHSRVPEASPRADGIGPWVCRPREPCHSHCSCDCGTVRPPLASSRTRAVDFRERRLPMDKEHRQRGGGKTTSTTVTPFLARSVHVLFSVVPATADYTVSGLRAAERRTTRPPVVQGVSEMSRRGFLPCIRVPSCLRSRCCVFFVTACCPETNLE